MKLFAFSCCNNTLYIYELHKMGLENTFKLSNIIHVYCQNAANIYVLSKKPFIIPGMQFIVME